MCSWEWRNPSGNESPVGEGWGEGTSRAKSLAWLERKDPGMQSAEEQAESKMNL